MPPQWQPEVAERMKALRTAQGITQENAAAQAGVRLRTWQRWEAGAVVERNLPIIAQALQTTPAELRGDSGSAAPRSTKDMELDERLDRIEAAQAAILALLKGAGGGSPDAAEVLREADALLGSEPPDSDPESPG